MFSQHSLQGIDPLTVAFELDPRRAISDEPAMDLLDDETLLRARQIGTVMRLGCTISGAVSGYLPLCPLSAVVTSETIKSA